MATKRSFSTDISDHEGLIAKFAFAAFGRLSSAGVIDPDLDDIKQDMRLSMHIAAQRWNPEVGISFTAYAGRAIWNNFNKYAERTIERRLPEITECDLLSGDDGGPQDFFATFDAEVGESTEDKVGQVSDTRAQLKLLSIDAKRVVVALLDPQNNERPTFSFIGRALGFDRAHMLEIRRELASQFGLESV